MTTERAQSLHITRWLLPSGILTLLAIGILWAVRPEWGYCVDGDVSFCDSGTTDWIAIAGIVGMLAVYAALTLVAFTVTSSSRTLVLWILTGTLAVVFLVAVAASFGGVDVPLPI